MVVFKYIPSIVLYTCTGCLLYISVQRFTICDTRSYWSQNPTTCLYRCPDCGFSKQLNSMWVWYINYPIFTVNSNTFLVFLPRMVLHYYMSFLFGHYLGNFYLIGCVGSPVDVIIHSRKCFPYHVAMYNHKMACNPFLNWLNHVMYYCYRWYSSITLSII